MIYLDYAAATPVLDEVLDTFYETNKMYFANPNSNHKMGLEVKNLIDESTKNIADRFNVNIDEIIYTSGASETNNLVIKGVCQRYKNRGKHIIMSAIEHNSIMSSVTDMLEQGFEVDIVPLNKDGLVDIDELKKLIRNDTILVSVCAMDGELGLKQPIEEIGLLLKDYPNIIFHTDATQSVGKVNIDFANVDLVTITPHKFYGLNGIGILIKKKNVSLKSQISGGKSTTIYRSGTPDFVNIVAASKALSIALDNQDDWYNYVKDLSDYVKENLKKYDNVFINNTDKSIPHIINFGIKGIKALDLQKKLEDYDIYVSPKTSCCPLNTPSKSVYALTKDKKVSTESVRLSIAHFTTKEEIDEFLKIFDLIYKEYENGKI